MGESGTGALAATKILDGVRGRAFPIAFAASTLALFVGGIVILPRGSTAVHAWMDLGWTFFSALAALSCARAARHDARPGRKKAWWAFAFGAFGWMVGIVQWSYLELVAGVVTPFPAIADVGFLSLPVGFAAGLFFYGSDSPGVPNTLKQLGDLGIVLATIGLCACFVFANAITHAAFPFWYGVTAVAYPVFHLSALFFGLMTLWSRSWHRASIRVASILFVAMLVLAVVTTYYAQVLLIGTYEAGHLMDPLWPLTFALMYIASTEERRREASAADDEPVRVTLGDALVPPVCVAVTAVVGNSQGFDVGATSPMVCAFGVGLAIALGVRNVAQRRIEATLRDQVLERERQFVVAQKMEAVATLAGGLAHDFNNLLTGVLGGVGMLRIAERTGQHDSSHLDLIEQSAQRAAELTKRLLVFARRRETQITAMSPWDVVRRAAMLVRSAAPDNVVVREEGAPRALVIDADASQLEHALVNLGLNAVHAMPLGGQLNFSFGVLAEGAGRSVFFEVRDTGVGIPDTLRDRIFEPFYSTRAPGEGTGLGLAMVRAAARAHDGRIDLESKVGEGTTFRIVFPLVEGRALASVPPATTSSLSNGSETVLVVDDRGVALLTAQAMLESAGYRVLATSRLSEARDIASSNIPIDAMLIDIMMPDADGFEVARQLRTMLPGIPVVLATGHLPPTDLPHWVSSVVEKPYRPKSLTKAIRSAIDDARQAQNAAESGAA